MAISPRAFGVGLVGASIVASGGYLFLREHPEITGRFGEPKKLFGFAGGEKEGFSDKCPGARIVGAPLWPGARCPPRRIGRDGARACIARPVSAIFVAFLLGPGRSRPHQRPQPVARPGDLHLADRALLLGPDRRWPRERRFRPTRRRSALHDRSRKTAEGDHRRRKLERAWSSGSLRTRGRRFDRSFQIQFRFHVCPSRGEPAQRRCGDARNPRTRRRGCRHHLQTDGF